MSAMFEIAKGIVVSHNNLMKEIRKDEEKFKKEFDTELHQVIENYCFRHFGKDDVSDKEQELLDLIKKVLRKFSANPQLF